MASASQTLALIYLACLLQLLCSVLAENVPRAPVHPDLFKPAPPSHAPDIAFGQNHTATLLPRDGSFGRMSALNLLRARQKMECPAGYPVSCPGTTCCPGGTHCVRFL